MPESLRHLTSLVRAAGPLGALRVLAARRAGWRAPLRLRAGGRQVEVRPCDSDLFSLAQVFGAAEYRIAPERLARLRRIARDWTREGHVPVIVDGGANVGYASLYLAGLVPEARVIAVEPHPATFEALARNCAGEPRIVPLRAALWSGDAGVTLGDGGSGSWSTHVTGPGEVPSRTLAGALAEVEGARLLVLKLDVEGSEAAILAQAAPLLAEVPCIMVEPHDFLAEGMASLAPLYAAVAGRRMDTLLVGETLMLFDGRA